MVWLFPAENCVYEVVGSVRVYPGVRSCGVRGLWSTLDEARLWSKAGLLARRTGYGGLKSRAFLERLPAMWYFLLGR